MRRRVTRFFNPVGFVLAGLCLLLPFAVVACDTPGGYGRSAPGGTTTYTGFDLVVGDYPTVDPKHLRPPEQRRDDRLDPQVLALAAVLLIATGLAVSASFVVYRRRRWHVAALAGVAAVFVVANQATLRSLLTARIEAEAAAPMPPDKSAGDFVHAGNGFWACLLVLGTITVANLIVDLRGARRDVRAAAGPAVADRAGGRFDGDGG